MRIAVVGTGGVGGYIAAKLSVSDRKDEVVCVARGDHAETIRSSGITVIEDDGTFIGEPSSVVDLEGLNGRFDLVLLCVKSYAIDDSVAALKPCVDKESIVIPFANGVNHAEVLKAKLDARVLNGCIYVLSHIQQPGIIRKQGKVFAAVFGGDAEAAAEVAAVFEAAGLRYKIPGDIEAAVWKKYLFISAFAALTTYFDMPIKQVYTLHQDEAEALLEEIASVAQAKGIVLEHEIAKALATAAGLPDDASTSMHLDVQNGRQSELETLCGYIVHEGERLGVEVPLMRKIYEALKPQG